MYIIAAIIIITFAVLWYNTRPASADIPGDKFNPYCEDHEQNFDADYEAKDRWRREYEHMN